MRRTEAMVVKGYGNEPGVAEATVESFERTHRVGRALKGLGMAWLIAVGCVFIPVAHFVLVPGFVLAGLVVFAMRLNRREEVVEVSGSCPDCQVPQNFEVGTGWRPPFSTSCRGCGRGLELTV